jgi:tetratricopeptide (TPR) repeat protein
LFVGRTEELDLFEQVLWHRRPEWIIHVLGSGGIGKTRLLEQMWELVQEEYPGAVLVTEEVVDFYKTANHTPLGLLDDLAHQLGHEHFQAFVGEAHRFRRLIAGEPDVAERHEAEEHLIGAFFEEYDRLVAERPVVLLFDTCEEMRGIEPWFINTFLRRLATLGTEESEETEEQSRPSHAVVVAGRRQLDFPGHLERQVVTRTLRPFTTEEVQEYFRIGGLGPERVTDEEVARIHGLAEGRLLYVALAFDWLYNEVGTVEELTAPGEPFGEKLVSWVLRLGGHEAKAVLYMAQAWRRMEPSMLAHLLQIGEEGGEKVADRLARFSFIKYRPPGEDFGGSVLLHDEMRDLTLSYAWPRFGSGDAEHQLLRQVNGWYERQVWNSEGDGVLKGKSPPRKEKTRYLLAEWVYYRCRVDLDEGARLVEPLFRRAIHHLDLGFGELLNEELGRFRRRLSRPQLDELRFREALVASRREQLGEAVDIWRSLIRQPDLTPTLRATVLQQLVEAEAYTGHVDDALAHAEEGERLYRGLLEDPDDASQCSQLERELGQLYNNWGYAHRAKGDWKQALKRYGQALEMPGGAKNIARTLNNMGYVHFLRGDLIAARTHIGRGLSMRKESNIPYELGLGYNTMGIVMERSGRYDDAADLYDKALAAFEEARSERGRALALINLGRLRRVTNSFDDAIRYLDEAKTILERKRDYDYLVEALNELGCVYRHRREEGDWEKAVRWLEESCGRAEAIGNTFREADNLEDLSVLYVQWAQQELEWGEQDKAEVHLRLAEEKGIDALELAEEHGYEYLKAKTSRTFGDVAYVRGEYEQAFEHYLNTCLVMADVVASERGSVVQMRRRYEEMVDHLQEQLHELSSQEAISSHAQRLRGELYERGLADQLEELTHALDQSQSVSQRIRVVEPLTPE